MTLISPPVGEIHARVADDVSDEFNFTSWYPRLLNFGLSYSDLERIRRTAKDWATFSRAMGDLARHWKRCAEKAWQLGRLETPREQWKRAASYYHYAQLHLPESSLKERFRRASRGAYEHVAPLLDPPAIRCKIPFRSLHLPGYLRVKRPGAPCIILIGGVDLAKEVELHHFAEIFLSRCCSVFYFDGPGQGELRGKTSMDQEFERVISAVIDFLRQDSRVGAAPIGCFGAGLGGYLACRAAASDPRIEACVSMGGFFDSTILRSLTRFTGAMLLKVFGLIADDNTAENIPPISLEPLRGRMKTPLLIVHGASDQPDQLAQILALRRWACGPVHTLLMKAGDHACYDRLNECLPGIGDWMTNWLLHKNKQEVAFI